MLMHFKSFPLQFENVFSIRTVQHQNGQWLVVANNKIPFHTYGVFKIVRLNHFLQFHDSTMRRVLDFF